MNKNLSAIARNLFPGVLQLGFWGILIFASLTKTGALAQSSTDAANASGGPGADEQSTPMEEIVVTASAFPEARSRIASTLQVIDLGKIQASGAPSVTDIFAENAGGFLSEWSPDQTSINIRGGASDGQGRDYLSDVLVLINGRRAGTANISKLSLDDVERIETIRGPASVIYGSQNIGGVINIITKDGRNVDGGMAEIGAGSSALAEAHAEDGGSVGAIDWFVGLSAGRKSDYGAGAGGGIQLNTAWHRAGGSGAIGLELDDNNRVDFEIRSDGCYDCGFRGSQENIYDRDDRFNQSAELTYSGHTPDGQFTWSVGTVSL